MESTIVIKPNYNFDTIFKVSLLVCFRKPSMKFILVLNSLVVIFLLINFNIGVQSNMVSLLKYYFVFLVLWPILLVGYIYVLAKRSSQNPKLKEEIIGTYTSDYFEERGATFTVKFYWKDIARIDETKKYFLLKVNKSIVKFIAKADLKDNQYQELKTLFNSLNIKKSLK